MTESNIIKKPDNLAMEVLDSTLSPSTKATVAEDLQNTIINLNKPFGWTSFEAVAKFKRINQIKKIGHAGTLDPLATGVLLLATGKCTKIINDLQEQPKEYLATFVLGATTASFDTEFFPTEFQDTRKILPELVKKTIETKFVGNLLQKPPAFSAVKLNGKRAYDLARQNIEIEELIQPKSVTVREFEARNFELISPNNLPYNAAHLRSYQNGMNKYQSIDFAKLPKRIKLLTFEARIICSKGTYIRSLIRDLAATLNTVGYMLELRRQAIGDYRITESIKLE